MLAESTAFHTGLLLTLFGSFVISAAVLIRRLGRGQPDAARLERLRVLFLFSACLLLACLGTVWLTDQLSPPVLCLNLAGIFANLLGLALAMRGNGRPAAPRPSRRGGARAYQLYLNGAPFGLITRETFAELARCELLKKQRTVELVDDYQQRASRQQVEVQRFTNREGLTLIKVGRLRVGEERAT